MSLVLAIDGVWIALAVVGIVVSVWSLVDSYIDRQVLGQDPSHTKRGPRSVIVRLNLRGAQASLLLHTFFLLLGVLALGSITRTRPNRFYFELASGYILVAAANLRALALNQIDRVRLRRGMGGTT